MKYIFHCTLILNFNQYGYIKYRISIMFSQGDSIYLQMHYILMGDTDIFTRRVDSYVQLIIIGILINTDISICQNL